MSLHETESRADLELRFLALGSLLIAARAKAASCALVGCRVCARVNAAVDGKISPTGHEPREDLEDTCVLLSVALTRAAAEHALASLHCPAGAFLGELLLQVESEREN